MAKYTPKLCKVYLHGGRGLEYRDWTLVLVDDRQKAVKAFQRIQWNMTGHWVNGARFVDPETNSMCTRWFGSMLRIGE